jgi:hypothetical protein
MSANVLFSGVSHASPPRFLMMLHNSVESVLTLIADLADVDQQRLECIITARHSRRAKADRRERRNRMLAHIIATEGRPFRTLEHFRTLGNRLEKYAPDLARGYRTRRRSDGSIRPDTNALASTLRDGFECWQQTTAGRGWVAMRSANLRRAA